MEGLFPFYASTTIVMKKLLLLVPIVVIFAACKDKKEEKITKKWQAVALESPTMDQMIADQAAFLDTFGKNTTPKQNDSLYGTQNVDSMRESLRLQLNDFKSMQEHSVKNTWFHFMKDGKAMMNFSGQPDSTNWYFDEEGALILDEMKMKGTGNKIKMDVVQLEDTVLKLRFTENGMTSTVTFHPTEK
ncbi:MAG: hypothetical protein K0R82_2293 [Flavipsychrobacter sp.]|nr:hypothetical protein [Flavipsychrobacter sp.]